MRINEVSGDLGSTQRLVALSQFLIGRADDTNAQKKISVNAFIQLAANQGISLTREQLIDLSQKSPLNNLIANVEGDEIIFKGEDSSEVSNKMTVDQARKTVDTMAKRATRRDIS